MSPAVGFEDSSSLRATFLTLHFDRRPSLGVLGEASLDTLSPAMALQSDIPTLRQQQCKQLSQTKQIEN